MNTLLTEEQVQRDTPSHTTTFGMTNGFRQAMTCACMPDGATFNGMKNILTDEQVAKLKVGDVLTDEFQNPLICKKSYLP
jgi:phytanoyl-CoA hydroxylase